MEKRKIDEIESKTLDNAHGETVIYQLIFGRGTEKPNLMKSITSLFMMTIMPGGTNKLHVHGDEEQIYIVIEGGGTVQVGDETMELKKGDAVYLPPQIGHAFLNDQDKPCKILAVGARIPTPGQKRL